MKKILGDAPSRRRFATPLYYDEGNRACYGAIQQIARGEFSLAFPLVIVGEPDTGKTRHLMELANLMIQRGKRVITGTASEWAKRFREACSGSWVDALAREIDDAELLVIDEFHRLMRSTATLGFLLNRIHDRAARKKATAIAVRHAPRSIRNITDRAASLLLGGFVVYISKAGALVRRRFASRVGGARISPADVERICSSTPGGLGALSLVIEDWAARSKRAGQTPAAPLLVDRIVAAVARETGVDALAITGRRRSNSCIRARQILVLTARKLGFGLEQIARALDGRGRLAIRRMEEQAAASADASVVNLADRIAARLREEIRAVGTDLKHSAES